MTLSPPRRTRTPSPDPATIERMLAGQPEPTEDAPPPRTRGFDTTAIDDAWALRQRRRYVNRTPLIAWARVCGPEVAIASAD